MKKTSASRSIRIPKKSFFTCDVLHSSLSALIILSLVPARGRQICPAAQPFLFWMGSKRGRRPARVGLAQSKTEVLIKQKWLLAGDQKVLSRFVE